jgi:hypothetical protein
MTLPALGAGPLWRIDGPLPLAPVYGLLQAASAPPIQIVPDADDQGVERWINGVSVWPYPPDPARIFDAASLCGSAPDEKAKGDAIPLPVFSAFTVYLPVVCTTRVIGGQDEIFRARAVAALSAVESSAAESVLIGGAGLTTPFLGDGQGTFPNSNTATSPMNGLALLEQEIAKSQRQGVIHLTPALVTALRYSQLVIDDGRGVLRTINGTVVIPGAGYVGASHPIGHPAASGTKEWAYATGPIQIRRSGVFVNPETPAQATDREINETVYRAERYYLVNWDTAVQAAVLIDRCQTTC